ncbi:MAG: hypothetical protein A4S17_01375 [Proteobacteria bacterium HN_bin10]|nr:MAG: hypothetical protein A4S17_01375 [Proteobacteria bacterium HN_bin10]
MLLSDDKMTHLSHVILSCLKRQPGLDIKGDEAEALREIKRVLAAEVAAEDEIDRAVRARLGSYSRPIVEGSPEWDVLYRKTADELAAKRRV